MKISLTQEMKNKKTILTGCLFLLEFAYAISFTMVGPLMPTLIEEYGLKLSQGGLIMTFQSIGGILAIIIGGVLADLLRKSRLILITFAVYTLTLFSIGFAPGFVLLLGIFFILGASTRMLDTVNNAYIADIHQEKRGLYLNILHTSFGVGALLGPLYSRFVLSSGISWNWAYRLFGVICLVITVIYVFIIRKGSVSEGSKEKAAKPGDFVKLLTSFEIWLLCIIMFLYVGQQASLTVWLPMYMEEFLKSNVYLASFSLSTFWIGIIVSRIICSRLLLRFTAKQLIQWGALSGGIILTTGIVINNPYILVVTIGLTGLLTGATIPLLVTMACNLFPRNSGSASSMIFLNGTISTMIFPWFIGFIAEVFNFRLGMLLPGVFLLIIFLLGFVKLQRRKDAKS